MNEERLLLLDGNSVINRAYFALAGRRPLTAADGTPTGALLGFLNIYLKLADDLKPTHVCAAFDRKEPTFRHLAYDGYKATRKAMPDDLAVQMPLIKEILQAMGIRTVELAGYEADDLIGTIAKRMGATGTPVSILSGDRDGLQLVDDRISLHLPVSRAGQTTTEVFDRGTVVEKYGVTPDQLIDVKAIMGDASDNIPGVRGIGEKGALELIARFGSLDGVYGSLDSIRPALAEKLVASRETAYLSRDLARIDLEVPIELDPAELARTAPDMGRLTDLLERLGLRSIAVRLGAEAAVPSQEPAAMPDPGRMDILNAGELVGAILGQGYTMAGIACTADRIVLALGDPGDGPADTVKTLLLSLEDGKPMIDAIVTGGILLAGFDLKRDIKRISADWHHVRMHDVLIAAYLLSQLDGKPDFGRIYEACTGKRYVPVITPPPAADAGRQAGLFDTVESHTDETTAGNGGSDGETAARQLAEACLAAAATQRRLLRDTGMAYLSDGIEMPLVPVLADMETCGFQVDRGVLDQLSGEFLKRIGELEEDIHKLCGGPFNINSPKQLSDVLFERLGLPGGKKNASGNYSTDADELDRLSALHPAVVLILEYRQLAKLRSTFVEGLAKVLDPQDGRVHTTFNQAVTATGRLSSTEPNLQNIPVRAAVGREIRKAFVAGPGRILLDADYSQIELRLLAHLSGDEAMIEAYLAGKDIHNATAAKIFSVGEDRVTSDMRAAAKTVNFSIAYGVSGFGLARSLGIGVAEAQRYIDEYYHEFPGIRKYLEGLVASAYQTGYAETLFGRRRLVPELKSANRNIRNFGERVAMNTPVQGTAADIMKIAMIRVTTGIRDAGLESRLILQVHDELIVEALPEEADTAAGILRAGMESAADLRVPLLAEVRRGASWFDTK